MVRATIIADASWCPDTKVAGYAFYISSDLGRHGGQGIFKDPVKGSNEAEAMALVNAVYTAAKMNLVGPGCKVLLQSDSTAALGALSGTRKFIFGDEKRAQRLLRRVGDKLGLFYEYKHVPGHTDPSYRQGRYVTNRICDERAKKQMRRARQIHNLNTIKQELMA